MSAESGISTFRDAGGLWEQYDILEVASIDGWLKNPALVLDFYNQRRKQLFEVQPNAAHYALVELERKFDVQIVTQNVDDLQERAGSKNVLHLHGELLKVRSTIKDDLIYHWPKDLRLGDYCEKGYQLRPHIVWFGEMVPLLPYAAQLVVMADILVIIGTSMQVYPAASLAGLVDEHTPIYYIDPNPTISCELENQPMLSLMAETACAGVPKLVKKLLAENDTD